MAATGPPGPPATTRASITWSACCAALVSRSAPRPIRATADEEWRRPERNVIAQTRTGDPASVVMIGAHLDSVPDGPGIVDDGSGVASLLEIATQLGADPSVKNTVRFAFFGDEETGAEGSNGYIQGLSNEDRKKIKLYLNVDMVASPNGGYFVQGGKGDDRRRVRPAGFGHDRTGARRPVGQDRRDRAGDHRVRRRRRISRS